MRVGSRPAIAVASRAGLHGLEFSDSNTDAPLEHEPLDALADRPASKVVAKGKTVERNAPEDHKARLAHLSAAVAEFKAKNRERARRRSKPSS